MHLSKQRKKIVEYRIYETPMDFPVILLDGEDWHISDVRSIRLHFHNCFEVGICHSDSGTIVLENSEHQFRMGDVTCIPKHIAHTTFSSRGTKSLWSYMFLDFEKLLGDSSLAQGPSSYGKLQSIDFFCLFTREEHPRINFYVMSIVDELRAKKPGYEMIVKGLFQALHFELLRLKETDAARVYEGMSSTYILAPALNYICANYMNRFSIEDLAEICHLSAAHFRREFLSIIGTTPLNYVNTMRVEKACDMLRTTSESIISIAESVGFASHSSFGRCFLQIMGVSPRDYRNSNDLGELKPERRCILPYSGWKKAEELSEQPQ
jgi:AraC-like DNA-binding protein